MSTELLALLFEKARVPHAIKYGLFMSYVVFKAFNIEGRVKHAMKPE